MKRVFALVLSLLFATSSSFAGSHQMWTTYIPAGSSQSPTSLRAKMQFPNGTTIARVSYTYQHLGGCEIGNTPSVLIDAWVPGHSATFIVDLPLQTEAPNSGINGYATTGKISRALPIDTSNSTDPGPRLLVYFDTAVGSDPDPCLSGDDGNLTVEYTTP